MSNKSNDEDSFLATALVVVFFVSIAAIIAFVGYMVFTGVTAVEQQKGYCQAIEGRYYSGDGPKGLCIRDNIVIKEWK